MSSDDRTTGLSSKEIKAELSYRENAIKSKNGSSLKSYSDLEETVTKKLETEPTQEPVLGQQKRAAKIHDFCFGIPYGGIVLFGGFVGFVFSRNPANLGTGIFFGGPLLALSTLSLKIWRKGKSSLPYILGQAVLAGYLMWRSIQTYSLTNKLLPSGFHAAISAAMLCFYSYVVLSGGNPPPKKRLSVTA